MVRLTRIYTRGGDTGETSLGDGSRVPKQSLRVEAFGTVDEANAAIGLARLHLDAAADAETDHETGAMLARIQNDLFDLGADLCTPEEGERAARRAAKAGGALRIIAAQVTRLETEIDAMNAGLKPLDSFILPGGTPAAAYLHLARTIVRRAERLTCALAAEERVNPEAVKYLNRLSDHLFVLGRRLNDNGAKDVLWQPGLTRDPTK
jgi:cob(I)alamin adenosyltransferase